MTKRRHQSTRKPFKKSAYGHWRHINAVDFRIRVHLYNFWVLPLTGKYVLKQIMAKIFRFLSDKETSWEADMLRTPEGWQSLTMFPGIPAWPLSPGAPCGKGKESHCICTWTKAYKNTFPHHINSMYMYSHRLTGSPLSPGDPGIPGTPGVPVKVRPPYEAEA